MTKIITITITKQPLSKQRKSEYGLRIELEFNNGERHIDEFSIKMNDENLPILDRSNPRLFMYVITFLGKISHYKFKDFIGAEVNHDLDWFDLNDDALRKRIDKNLETMQQKQKATL